MNDLPGELKLQESFPPETVTVPRLQPSQAYKTLGHLLALDGNQREQMKTLETKMRTWSNKVKTKAIKSGNNNAAKKAKM